MATWRTPGSGRIVAPYPDSVVDQDPKIIEIVPPVRPQERIVPRRFPIKQLPIVGEHYWVQSTAAGTIKVRSPSTGMKLRLTYIHLSALGTVYAFLQFHNHAQSIHRICPAYMAANTVMNANLVDTSVEGDVDEALEVVTDSANQLDCMVVIEEIPGKVSAEKPQEE